MHSCHVTTGETDWIVIAEFADGADLIPAPDALAARLAITDHRVSCGPDVSR